ncbi:MAG: immunoglobulin [Clostridia bacterium]|nr:immunoglobulin [Clostridia bacterium]
MKLTPAEKETIILTSEADETASVSTYDHRLKKKLNALAERFPEQIRLTETLREGGVSYTIPKSCIVIYPPHGETWRKAVTERARTKGFQKKTEK